MSNKELYHFADFTTGKFKKLIVQAKKKYTFRGYHDFNRGERFVLWRHDVDCSMNAAVKLAKIEAAEGVKATYFFHLHSEFYNLLETNVTKSAREIVSLGHHVGLHFDPKYYSVLSKNDLEEALFFEKSILEHILGKSVQVFSFHNPISINHINPSEVLSGMVNVYSEYFQKNVPYISDSNGYWRFKRLQDVLLFGEESCLQVLTHPEWWQETIMSPKQKIWRCIDERAETTKEWYLDCLKKSKRDVIDWE